MQLARQFSSASFSDSLPFNPELKAQSTSTGPNRLYQNFATKPKASNRSTIAHCSKQDWCSPHKQAMSTNASQSGPSHGTSTVAVSFAAIGSVLAAPICCLPLFPFMMAAGLAGTSTFLSQLRPYLLIGSILFVALGF